MKEMQVKVGVNFQLLLNRTVSSEKATVDLIWIHS